MKIYYFYDNGAQICVCFKFRGRVYHRACRWANDGRLYFRFIRRLWFSEARAERIYD